MSKTKDEAIKQDNAEAERQGNMRIWDKVATTDPDHTKPVEFGRKFTAIDAHYQVMTATQTFGPVGEGWGYETSFKEIFTETGEIVLFCDLTFWWSPFEKWEGMPAPAARRTFGPVRGCTMLMKKGKTPDTDAPKKAMTDALTKCLSHLGFNADVFLGMFDDNKYVSELRAKKDQDKTHKQQAYEIDRKRFIDQVKACTKPESVDAVLENHKLWMAGLPVSVATEMRTWALKIKTEIADGSK